METTGSARRSLLSRRGFHEPGGLGLCGLALPDLLRAETQARPRAPRARSCILFFMEGGPAHQDLWDMKPDAPVEYRGEFKPIATTVPGLQVCEHLPLLARRTHHAALVRSVRHTLVVAMGEFGSTPRIGQIASSAGADAGGRDHWPHCYTVLFAGGGIQGGAIYGESDRYAAHPARDPVGPEDIAATIYAALGLDPRTEIRDNLDRPFPLATGKPIDAILS